MTAKRIPAPMTFMVVTAMVIALSIFLGAWAVSVDAEDGDRAFSLGFPAAGTISQSASADGSPSNAYGDQALAPGEESAADSWWGQALIKACPLH